MLGAVRRFKAALRRFKASTVSRFNHGVKAVINTKADVCSYACCGMPKDAARQAG